MEKKNQNGIQSFEPGSATVEGPDEDQPNPARKPQKSTWLSAAAGLDPDTGARKRRLLASELFMRTKLVPCLGEGRRIDESSLTDLLVNFKRSRSDQGTDFEISHVMGTLLNRFQYHFIDETGDGTADLSDSLEQDVLVFASLADLDLAAVDDAVRKRLTSG